MNVFKHFRGEIVATIEAAMAAGDLPAGLDLARVAVEPPRDAGHGDLATNAAMVLAKPAELPPRQVAERLLPRLATLAMVDEVGIAGPGFVNLPRGRPTANRAWAPGGRSTSNMSRPTRPARCISPMPAAPWSATPWRRCSSRSVTG